MIGSAHPAASLLLFRGVVDDPVGQSLLRLLRLLHDPAYAADVAAAYADFFLSLARTAAKRDHPLVDDAWQSHLLERLLADENPFSLAAQRQGPDDLPAGLVAAARCDLAILQRLYDLDLEELAAQAGANTEARLPVARALLPAPSGSAAKPAIVGRFTSGDPWSEAVEALARHYAAAGSGLVARFRALRWQAPPGRLVGIARPDPITLDDLIGYQRQRQLVVDNTEQFLAGYPANNVLLYGDRGTGKSSTIKALLNAYHERGLRMVEVGKQDLADFPTIVGLLRDQPRRFILFIDDLSFDEGETQYKYLKAVLEGSLESRPENVLLYATSNRRHLVQERFSDRPAFIAESEEIHKLDTVQEKLSLSDRFGITITFVEPDQEQFLAIVRGLAARRGLPIEQPDLERRALQWIAWNNGRSGRTARQFIDHLTGQLGLEAVSRT